MKFTFQKSERLTQVKIIDTLFQKDSQNVAQRFVYPFRVLYQFNAQPLELPQILISVPKRKFKKAVDRNLIKRRIREAYRLNKAIHLAEGKEKLPDYMAFVYIASTIEPFERINKKMQQVLQEFSNTEKDATTTS